MAGNRSGPSSNCQSGTWRSGAESPPFPGSNDARRLLRAARRTADRCTLVRVRLADRDEETLLRVRERLLGEDHIVATSIGREAGPGTPGTFDMLVVPDYDPATVGRAVAAADDVVGVAATTFRADDDTVPGEAPEPGTPVDGPPPGHLAALEGGTDSNGSGQGDEDDLAVLGDAPLVDGLDALEDDGGGHPPRGPPSTESSAGGSSVNADGGTTEPRQPGDAGREWPARANGGGASAEEFVRRLDAIERRLADVEAALEDDRDDEGSIDRRVASLEETVEDLERWQRRLRSALLEDGPE